jgi:hypothetical protein
MVSVSMKDGVAQATFDKEIGREGTPPAIGDFKGSTEKEIVAELLCSKVGSITLYTGPSIIERQPNGGGELYTISTCSCLCLSVSSSY